MACSCPYSFTRRWKDRLTGEWRTAEVPCGHCAVCQRNFQDQWAFRLEQEAVSSGSAIYFTLTYRPSSLPLADLDCLDLNLHSSHVQAFLEKFPVGEVRRKDLVDWVKRGRMRYRRARGKDAPLKYFITSEYGEGKVKGHGKWRPHYHGFFFGVKLADVVEFWLNPWREDFGFVDFKDLPLTLENIRGVSNYVSKYCNKQDFECPLVQEGICAPCFRAISKGIGAAFLDSPHFSWQISKDVLRAKSIGEDKRSVVRRILNGPSPCGVTQDVLTSLSFCRDTRGYKHKLPLYYKSKLLGYEPSIFKYKVQSYLRADFLRDYLTRLGKWAQISVKRFNFSSPFWGLSCSYLNSLVCSFDSFEAHQNAASFARLSVLVANHYRRSSMRVFNPI